LNGLAEFQSIQKTTSPEPLSLPAQIDRLSRHDPSMW